MSFLFTSRFVLCILSLLFLFFLALARQLSMTNAVQIVATLNNANKEIMGSFFYILVLEVLVRYCCMFSSKCCITILCERYF